EQREVGGQQRLAHVEAREWLALGQGDGESPSRQQGGDRRPARAAPHDQDIHWLVRGLGPPPGPGPGAPPTGVRGPPRGVGAAAEGSSAPVDSPPGAPVYVSARRSWEYTRRISGVRGSRPSSRSGWRASTRSSSAGVTALAAAARRRRRAYGSRHQRRHVSTVRASAKAPTAVMNAPALSRYAP